MEKIKILLLEDNKLDAELIKEELMLNKFNFTSHIVETEKGFIDAIHNFKPDLILSDYNLPQFTGFEALEIAIATIPNIPFIIVTGSLTEETAAESIKKGAWDYVIKENLVRLTSAIENAFKLKEEKEKNKFIEEELLKLSSAVFQSPSIIVITDLDGKIEYVNPKFTKLTGYFSQEAIGHNSSILKSGEHPDEMYRELWETIKSGKEWRGEFHNKKKNGELFWESASISPIVDAQGIITNYLKVAEDRTDSKKAEFDLIQSEKRFRSLFDDLGDAVFVTVVGGINKGQILEANLAATKQTGYTKGELLQLNIMRDLSIPETTDDDLEELDKQIEGGKYFTLIEKKRKKDGTEFWSEITVTPIEYRGQKASLSISHDITQRKQAAEDLANKERTYRTLVNNLPGFTYRCQNDENWTMNFISNGCEEITGYTPDDFINNKNISFDDIIDPDYTQKIREKWNVILKKRSIFEYEYQIVTKNQKKKWIWEKGCGIYSDKGDLQFLEGFITDITERKRTEQIQNVLFNISNAVIRTTDLKDLIEIIRVELGNIVDTKNFYIALYDSITDTITSPFMADEKDSFGSFPAGKTLTYYVIKTQKPLLATKEKIKELEESGDVEGFGSDSEIWLGVPLKVGGKVTGVFAVQSYTDENAYDESDCEVLEFIADQISISIDRKKAEQELIQALEKATESERLKKAFLNNFSHEIRTPMNGILGFVDLLKIPDLTGDDKQKYINIIEASGDRMLVTVNDLVNISMIESGQAKVLLSDINIVEQVEDIYSLLKLEADKKGLALLLNNSISANEALVSTDRNKIYGVLTNLVKNAIKFTHKGSVEFGCSIKGDNLEFYVTDTGIGIPKNRQVAIFDRFVKADIEDKAVFEGSGLGLSIAKSFVEMLGGSLWVESQEGVGSQFYFTIPFVPVKSVLTEVKDDMIVANSGSMRKNLTILIVEDDEVSAELLTILLGELEATLLYAKTGAEAIEIMHNNTGVDVILMDIRMSVMNGYEAAKQIRTFNNEVIIIAQTAFALKGDREKAIDIGCDDYISKPINRNILIKMINRLV
jgi:PAS domain S-box-containing protein